jgi:REP element-mobilizing transposase RayT
MGGIVLELESKAVIINGPADHVHLLVALSPKIAMSDFMRTLKANSSRWVYETFPGKSHFAWQTGYGAFSVSESNRIEVEKYIAKQEEHHHKLTFTDEFIALLKKHGIDYDERYIWE